MEHDDCSVFDGFYQTCCCIISEKQQYSDVANMILEINPNMWDA